MNINQIVENKEERFMVGEKFIDDVEKELRVTTPSKRASLLKNIYKQMVVSNKHRHSRKRSQGKYFSVLKQASEIERFCISAYMFHKLSVYGLSSHATRFVLQNSPRTSSEMNDFLEQTGYAPGFKHVKGLKYELQHRNPGHVFTTGKPVSVNIGPKYARIEYEVFMDNRSIGKIVKVDGNNFNNTTYTGRVPGYVNSSILSGVKFAKRNSDPLDFVTMQYTLSALEPYLHPRRDGHHLRFV